MSKTSPVVLIFGAGANIGHHVGKAFAAKGYKVALAARSAKEAENTADQVYIQSDLTDSSTVPGVFSKVKAVFGIPSVVIYNAGAVTFGDAKNPLSISLADFSRDFNVNTTSTFVAAQQAVLGFEQLPESASKTFIFTGNITNDIPIPALLDQGVGKAGSAHIIHAAAIAYKDRGYKFYYADERKADGSAKYKVDGKAHGKLYVELSEGKSQGIWQQTFVKDVGYKHFPIA